MPLLHDSIVLPKVRQQRSEHPRRTPPSDDITSLSATSSRGRNITTGTVKKRSPYLSRNFTPTQPATIEAEKGNMVTDSETDRQPAASSARRHHQQDHRSSHRARHPSSQHKDQPHSSSSSSSSPSVVSASGHRKRSGNSTRKAQRTASPTQQQQRGRQPPSSPAPVPAAAVPLRPSSFRQPSPPQFTSRRNVPDVNVQLPTMPQRSDSSSASPRHRSSNHGDRHRHRRHHHHRSRGSRSPRHRSPHATPTPLAPEASPSRDRNNASPFHAGLQDILQGVFGHGARGPTEPELKKLADDLGGLIEGALLDRLVAELRAGLLEKLLVEYLEELVAGVVVKGFERANKKKRGKHGDKDDKSGDWKKTALKKAFRVLLERLTNKSD